jgi:ferredoxin
MRIAVIEEKCCGYASCIGVSPTLFEIGPDNVATVRLEDVPEDLWAQAREAVGACPTDAIVISE